MLDRELATLELAVALMDCLRIRDVDNPVRWDTTWLERIKHTEGAKGVYETVIWAAQTAVRREIELNAQEGLYELSETLAAAMSRAGEQMTENDIRAIVERVNATL